MRVVRGSDIFHLVHASALVAALKGPCARNLTQIVSMVATNEDSSGSSLFGEEECGTYDTPADEMGVCRDACAPTL